MKQNHTQATDARRTAGLVASCLLLVSLLSACDGSSGTPVVTIPIEDISSHHEDGSARLTD